MEEELIGKIARATIPGMSGAPDKVVQGTIIRLYTKKWDAAGGGTFFDPYERVEIEFSVPGSEDRTILDTARAGVTLVD